MISTEEIRGWLASFDPGVDNQARRSVRAVIALLRERDDPGRRTWYAPGHVTASGLVLADDGRAVLLVYHERLGRWLQPGGHLEACDATIVDAARREVREETGLEPDDAAPVLVGVDVHEIPAARGEPAHRHHDLMFRFRCPRRDPTPGPGVVRAVWWDVRRLGEIGVDETLRRAVGRAIARF